MFKYKIFNFLPEFGTNTYLVWEEISREAMIIDMSAPSDKIIEEIKKLDIILKFLINTHGHADHIGGNQFIKDNYQTTLMIHEQDAAMLNDPQKNLSSYIEINLFSPKADVLLDDNDEYQLGGMSFKIIHTPGHTKGGICLLFDDFIITGDTLFAESIGRTDFPGGNFSKLENSIKNKLFVLDDKLVVLPGHGPATTIGKERIGNPFVGLAARL